MNSPTGKKRLGIASGRAIKRKVVFRPGMDFSEVEDRKDFNEILRVLVAEAGREAALEAEAAGVSRSLMKGNQIISVQADKTVLVIESKNQIEGPYFRKYKKGTTFNAHQK